jgi:hypothetical protein
MAAQVSSNSRPRFLFWAGLSVASALGGFLATRLAAPAQISPPPRIP